MSSFLSSWAASVAAIAVLASLAMAVTPESCVKRVLGMVCGVAVLLTVVEPVLSFDSGTYALTLARYREQAKSIEVQAEDSKNRLSRTIIEDECAAYILDKAQEKGEDIRDVSVTVQWGGDCWYPVEAHVQGEMSPALSQIISADLGIPKERQYSG